MMVEQMGFSEKIGQIALKTGGGQSFLGNDAGRAATTPRPPPTWWTPR